MAQTQINIIFKHWQVIGQNFLQVSQFDLSGRIYRFLLVSTFTKTYYKITVNWFIAQSINQPIGRSPPNHFPLEPY